MTAADVPEAVQAGGDGALDARALLLGLIHELDVLVKDCRAAVLGPLRDLRTDPAGQPPDGNVQEAIALIRRADSEVRAATALLVRFRRSSVSANPCSSGSLSSEEEGAHAPAEGACCDRLLCRAHRRSHHWRELQRDRELWSSLDKARDYDFFHDILIAHDGGFSEVDQLWYGWRWFSAIVLVILIPSNVIFVITQDLDMILWRWPAFHDTVFLNQTILRWFQLDQHNWAGSRTICLLELVGLIYVVGRNLVVFLQPLVTDDELRKWRAIQRLSWKTMPQLCAYSGMRLLHFVAPSVLLADILKLWDDSRVTWTTCRLIVCKWVWFVISRLLIFIIGLDCLLVKVHQAHTAFVPKSGQLSVKDIYTLCLFVVQVMGIVQLQQVVMDRLFLFIFGGENAVMEPHERSLRSVWKAMLARQIWREHSTVRFLVIMLTFSDADFQKLVLNERGALLREESAGSEGELGSDDGAESVA